MMITNELIELQNWHIMALEKASRFAHLPVQKKMFAEWAEEAREEYKETYGEEMPSCVTKI